MEQQQPLSTDPYKDDNISMATSFYDNITIDSPSIYNTTDTTSATFIVFTTIRFIQGFIGFVGNILTIAAVLKYSSLQTNANIFVTQLAIADLFSSFGPPFELLTSYFEHDYRLWSIFCDGRAIFSAVTTQVNSLFVVIISVDRLIYIKYPLRYINLMTKWPMAIIIGSVWLMNLYSMASSPKDKGSPFVTFCDLPYISKASICFMVGGFFAFAAGVLIVVNSIIATIARRQQKEILKLTVTFPNNKTTGAGSAKNKVTSNDIKVIKMLMMVLGIYLVGYIPWIIIMTFEPILQHGPMLYRDYSYFTSVILWMNACANPFIYVWRDKKFRKAFLKLLGCGHLCKKVEPEGVHQSDNSVSTKDTTTYVEEYLPEVQ